MSEPGQLNWLIPTGQHDIAVRELLIPIFGNAMSCKVPGAACPDPNLENVSRLTEGLFMIFNAGTLVSATILLIFIGLVGFVKTAQDGEFFGRSWNTTFTALRLVAGIGFILPMPNNYSSIQNFVMYVGLWGSGFANQANAAISDAYLHRLYRNMAGAERGAVSMDSDAPEILKMHICASYTNKKFGAQGANLQMVSTRSMVGPATPVSQDALGNVQQAAPLAAPVERIEYAYLERGTYLMRDTAPCGRVVLQPAADWYNDVRSSSAVPSAAWGAGGFGSQPLTADARRLMMESLAEIGQNARRAKNIAIQGMVIENGSMRLLADRIVDAYDAGSVKFDADGNVVSSGSQPSAGGGGTTSPSTRLTADFATNAMNTYASIVANSNASLNSMLADHRRNVMQQATAQGGSFFAQTKDMLEKGGWMGAAATYRTMLDMVSISFQGEKQAPYKIESRDELSAYNSAGTPGGLATQLSSVSLLVDRMLVSDAARTIMTNATGAAGATSLSAPNVNQATLEKIATSKLDTKSAMELIYGSTWLNGWRNSLVSALTISPDYDPLFQIKAIGDSAAATAEMLITGETLVRGAMALSQTANAAAQGSAAGKTVDLATGSISAWGGLNDGVKYILAQVFALAQMLSLALVSIAFMFSTWLPSIPYLAFLMAQLGWLAGLMMTLFAVNIWGVMHLTPARNDSFIGSEAQGYLLIVSLFFRPVIATAALALSYIIAGPVMKLVNLTLLPMVLGANVSTNAMSAILLTMFAVLLYFLVAKGVLMMVFFAPQSFPDDVMRIISAGIGDLGQGKALGSMEAAAPAAGATGRQLLTVLQQKPSAEQYTGSLGRGRAQPTPIGRSSISH